MKKAMKKKSIVLCASASAYRGVLALEERLKKLGFSVRIPYTAGRMRASGDYRVETYKTWFKDPKKFSRKTWLMKEHFKKIKEGGALLVVNEPKNGMKGYVGGAVLTEMAVAFDVRDGAGRRIRLSDRKRMGVRRRRRGGDSDFGGARLPRLAIEGRGRLLRGTN